MSFWNSLLPRNATSSALLWAMLVFVEGGRAEESTIEAVCRTGAIVRGNLDANTDSADLWISSTKPGIALQTRIPWSELQNVKRGDQAVEKEALLEKARGLALTRVPPGTNHENESPPQDSAPAWPEMRRVRSLVARAAIGNWNANAAQDGIRLYLQVLDEREMPVAIHGQVVAKLLIETRRPIASTGDTSDVSFREIEEWTCKISRSDFDDGVVILELPFRRFDPEVDLAVEPTGWLRVRFGVPGQGVFEADAIDVVLRPASKIVDDLQLHRGSRLFPNEFRPRLLP